MGPFLAGTLGRFTFPPGCKPFRGVQHFDDRDFFFPGLVGLAFVVLEAFFLLAIFVCWELRGTQENLPARLTDLFQGQAAHLWAQGLCFTGSNSEISLGCVSNSTRSYGKDGKLQEKQYRQNTGRMKTRKKGKSP